MKEIANNPEVFYRNHHKCVLWSLVSLTVLYILRVPIIEALQLYRDPKSWMYGVDQLGLGILFVAFSLFASITFFIKWKKHRSIISDKYVSVSLIVVITYLYLRFISCFDFRNLLGLIKYSDFIFIPSLETCILASLHKKKPYETTKEHKIQDDSAIEDDVEDELGFGKVVDVLINDIAHTDLSKSAFSIGIVGAWGQGKSSMLNLFKKRLNSETSIVVCFNPRNSKDTKSIAEDFFNKFSSSLCPYYAGINSLISRYAGTLQIVFNSNLIGKFITALRSLPSNDEKESINRAIREIGRIICVIVDDLDRLTAKEILEVLKLIDRNADFAQTVFITAYDKQYVNEVLKSYLGYTSDHFTDKYFNYELSLPIPQEKDIYDIFAHCLQESSDGEVKDIVGHFWKEKGYRFTKYFDNVRHVKRFINIFLHRYEKVYEDVNVEHFFLLTVLRYYNPNVYNSLALKHYLELDLNAVSGNPKILRLKSNFGEMLPKEYNSQTVEILMSLFPEGNKDMISSYHCINDSDFFDLYFYDYREGKLYIRQLKQMFEGDDEQALSLFERYIDNDDVGLFRYLMSLTPIEINTFVALKRYVLLCLQYRTYCTIGNYNLIRQLCHPLTEDGYKEYNKVFGLKDKNSYKANILDIYSGYIQNYYFQLQQVFQQVYVEQKGVTPIIEIEVLRDLELKCQKTFFEQFDEKKIEIHHVFAVSLIFRKEGEKCDIEARRTLLNFMIDHSDYVARNIFDCSVEPSDDGTLLLLYLFIDKVYKGFDPWFPIDTTTFKDWIGKIGNDHLREIISCIYETADSMIAVPALKPNYDKTDFDEIWKALVKYKDNNDIKRINESLKYEYVYDLATLCKSAQLDADRINELYKEYKDDGLSLPPQYLKDTEAFRSGDIVKLTTNARKRLEGKQHIHSQLFIIKYIEDGNCYLKWSDEPVRLSEVLPVLCNGCEDKDIYYDPIIAASIIAPGQPVPIHHTDYGYYKEKFKKTTYQRKTFYEMLKEKNFNYVHEIQHWLEDDFNDDGLKIRK